MGRAPAKIHFHKPALRRDTTRGHGRWLRHTFDLWGVRYVAMLLSWELDCWPHERAGRPAAMSSPLRVPMSVAWKIDFRGQRTGPATQRLLVWDRRLAGLKPCCAVVQDDNAQRSGEVLMSTRARRLHVWRAGNSVQWTAHVAEIAE